MMAGLMLSLFLAALDNSIVATAMPKIIVNLHGMQYYSLPFTAYLLFSTVTIPITGKLSDVFGRKKVFLWGIVGFLITSLLCSLSATLPTLIVARGLQGACGGVISSGAFIVVSALFAPQERGKYIGILASMHGLASLLGPVVGGMIVEYLPWQWVFLINIPIGLISWILVLRFLPRLERNESSSQFDIKGIVLFLSALFPLLACFAEGGKHIAWSSPLLLVLIGISLASTAAFFRTEKRSSSPMLPAGLLSNRIFIQSAFTAAIGYIALFGVILYIPFLLQVVLKKGAIFSGMMMLPMSLSMVIGGIIGGILVSKFQQYKRQSVINFAIAIGGFIALLIMGEQLNIALLIGALILIGIGIGMNFPVVNIMPQAVFPVAQLGIVISTLEFFQIMGGVLSTSVLGNLLHFSLPALLLVCIAALCVGLISMLLLDEEPVRKGFARQYS
jgi:EmrB/QacA subfamily drug resistance transporter